MQYFIQNMQYFMHNMQYFIHNTLKKTTSHALPLGHCDKTMGDVFLERKDKTYTCTK